MLNFVYEHLMIRLNLFVWVSNGSQSLQFV